MAGGREGLHTNVGKKEEVCARGSRGRRAGGMWTHRQPIHKVYWGSLMSRHSLPPSSPLTTPTPSCSICIPLHYTQSLSFYNAPSFALRLMPRFLCQLAPTCSSPSGNSVSLFLHLLSLFSLPPQSCIINLQPMLFIE